MSLARRPWFVLILFGLLILITRWPLAPGQLFTFDDVNLAYAVGHYDIRLSQPHPPGYPLFVLEMRVLHWLRFKRAESILLFLALAGSILALVLLVFTGNRILGGDSGFWAAWMMLLHPVFWHAGVTSALRVQLAVVSLVVAASCWHAWEGDGRWVKYSAVALAIGAGIRPETGPLLFPLWAVCAWRAPLSWKERGNALAWMAGVVLVWLLPAMIASGGPLNFIRANLDYVSDQASVSSGLFGATESRWMTTWWRLMVWIFCGVFAWAMPAVLAFRRKDGWGIGGGRLAFLALWFVPAFVFALTVHVEDPGQTLAMLPVVCLVGGLLADRALGTAAAQVPLLLAPIAVGATIAGVRIYDRWQDMFTLGWMPLLCLGIALAWRIWPVENRGFMPRWIVLPLMWFPIMWINYTFFYHHGWYFKGSATSGVEALEEGAWADINSGLSLASLDQIKATLAVDDHTVREMQGLVAGRPGNTTVVWEQGLTAWRKAAYYAPEVPIVVLEHKKIRSSPPVIVVWKGARLERRLQGGTPLRLTLPAGSRVVWLLNSRTDFFATAQQNFALTAAGPVWFTDLPSEHGTRLLGEYEISW